MPSPPNPHSTLQKTTKKNYNFQKLSSLLYQKFLKEDRDRKYAKVKEVLTYLAQGGLLAATIIAPNIARLLPRQINNQEGWENWKAFNIGYLKRTLQRLKNQKMVEVIEKDGEEVITITEKGKKKILKYALEELSLNKPTRWDGKWRLIIYDIPNHKKLLREVVRGTLKSMEFYPIQESVYLTPYPCFEEIEFVRQFYNLEEEIKILVISNLENDSTYRTYFGLDKE